MIKAIASLLRRIVGRLKMNSDTIYGGMGAVALTIGFSFMAISTGKGDTLLSITALVLAILGIAMFTLAYKNAKRNERIDKEIKLIEFKNAVNVGKELSKTNENLSSLINEIRRERNERNKPNQ